MTDEYLENTYRYIARITLEVVTPISISSGETDILTDSLVTTDANGLPLIYGTSICGVIRHEINGFIEEKQIPSLFGYQGENSEGKESRLSVSSACFVGPEGQAIEGLSPINWEDPFFAKLKNLPIRQHCRLNQQGASDQGGKFDEQIVPKGARFKFELELVGNKTDKGNWENILKSLDSPLFRLGGGTRKGFGKLNVVAMENRIFDLSKELDPYLSLSPSLNTHLGGDVSKRSGVKKMVPDGWNCYVLKLQAEDFWLFGSGFGNEETDMLPVYEETIKWNDDGTKPEFSESMVLIPASSIKGALSHRVAFHYNKLVGNYADGKEKIDQYVGENNTAVRALFGCAKEDEDKSKGKIGQVLLSDLFVKNNKKTKYLNHVAIDRFTGGAIDAALFSEQVIAEQEPVCLELWVSQSTFDDDDSVKTAFLNTLTDICKGRLPLGGGTNRGHGTFLGTLTENGTEILQ